MFNRIFSAGIVVLLVGSVPVLATRTADSDEGYYSTIMSGPSATESASTEQTDGYYAFANKAVMELQPDPTDGRYDETSKPVADSDVHQSEGSDATASTPSEPAPETSGSGSFLRRAFHSAHNFFSRMKSHERQTAVASAPRSLWRKSVYRPVAGISPSVAGAAVYGAHLNLHEVNGQIVARNAYVNEYVFVKYSDDAIVRCAGGSQITFANGDIFVSATKDVFVTVSDTKVVIAAGAIVSLTRRKGVLSVRNLSESHQGCVGASLGGRLFPIRAGEELVSSRNFDNLADVARLDGVQLRKLSTVELPDGHVALKSEFDTASLFKSSSVLSQLVHSDNAIEKSLFNRVLKMAVCLQVVTGSDGFKPVN